MTAFEIEREMVLKAQDGDQEALMWLWDKYQSLVINISQRYKQKGIEYWEIVSCVKEGFFEGIMRHDPNLGYVGPYCRNWMRDKCKKAFANLRPVRAPQHRTDIEISKHVFVPNMHEDWDEEFYDKRIVRELIEELPEEQDRLLIKYRFDIDGMHKLWKEIVEEFGFTSVPMARMRLKRAIRRLKEILLEKGKEK